MKKSEKLAFLAAGIGVVCVAGLNYWLGSEVWGWKPLSILWALISGNIYLCLLLGTALERSVDK